MAGNGYGEAAKKVTMGNYKHKSAVRTAFMLLIALGLIPLLPMLISGRWNWWEAWVLTALLILTFMISRALAARKTPDILRERADYTEHEDTQPWDKWLSPTTAFGTAFILLTAGLDALFAWSIAFALGWELFGLALIVLGCLLGSYALIENAYFSGTVRIQAERGHSVVSGGPYAWVRHPGYTGSLLVNLGIPLLLDSAWAFVPAVILGALLVLRASLEDRFLLGNLPGYQQYAEKVRCRLLPGLW